VRSRRHARGLTLVEVLIVVVLIALLSGGALLGPGLLRSSRVRAAATLMVSGVRLAQNRTNANGRPVRMVIDLDQRRVSLEQASGSLFSREKGAVAGGAEAQDEAEKKAKAETERILEGARPARPKFTPLNDLADPEDGKQGRELGSGVQVLSVQTEHDEEPVTEGRAYIYFWPGGITERAIIRLKRSDISGSDDVLSVLVSPLTGKASIQRGNVDFPPPREDPDGSGFGPKEEE
jgi:general secretion pathway protein H